MTKPTIWVSNQVRPGFYYPCRENKGADHLRGYREAGLRLCFHLCKLLFFPCSCSYSFFLQNLSFHISVINFYVHVIIFIPIIGKDGVTSSASIRVTLTGTNQLWWLYKKPIFAQMTQNAQIVLLCNEERLFTECIF